MRPYVEGAARLSDCYISCYPNAGLPNAFGGYDELPADTAGALREFADSGLVNIVGGCCGTTPDHIRAIAATVQGRTPRPGFRYATVAEPVADVPRRRGAKVHAVCRSRRR